VDESARLDLRRHEDGLSVEQWQFETGAPIELVGELEKERPQGGDEVTVQGLRAKDGTTRPARAW